MYIVTVYSVRHGTKRSYPVVAGKQNHLYWMLGLGQCTICNTPPANIVVGILHTFVVVRVTTYSIQLSGRGVRIFPKTFHVVASRRGVASLTKKKLLELIEQEDPLPISSSLSDSFLNTRLDKLTRSKPTDAPAVSYDAGMLAYTTRSRKDVLSRNSIFCGAHS